jgi:hypothetical protein
MFIIEALAVEIEARFFKPRCLRIYRKKRSASNLWSIACEVPPYEWIRTKVGNQQANKRITMVLGNN